jgi:hypothetical protein
MRRRPRAALGGLALLGTISGTLAWRDLNSRSPDQIRGSRRFWRVLIAMNPGNSVLYWLLGRR